MTKIYDLIHLNNHIYMVDKDKILTIGTKYIDDTDAIREAVIDDPEYWKARSDYNKILASTDKSLGLPLLPNIKENIEQLAIEIIRRRGGWEHLFINNKLIHKAPPVPTGFWRDVNNIIEGYKAASAKKYTEEDMREAYNFGVSAAQETHLPFEDIIQSLNPLPIKVEVEMQGYTYDYRNIPTITVPDTMTWLLKVDKNNIVQVVNWIFIW